MQHTDQIIADFRAQGLEIEEGFDKPGTHYAPEKHERNLLYTVSGSIRIKLEGSDWRECRPGDIIEVPEGVIHEAVVGPKGWQYVAGFDPIGAKKYENKQNFRNPTSSCD